MSVEGHRAAIVTLTRELSREWERAKESWMDAKRMEFEEHYIDPLRAQVRSSSTTLNKLDKLLKKVRTDCE